MNDPTHAGPRPLDDVLDGDVHVAMVMTMIGHEHSSRPVTCVELSGDRLSFLVDASSHWVKAIERGEAVVHVTIAEQTKNTYVAVNGDATVTADATRIGELWNPAAGIYFDGGKDDPNVRALEFVVRDGEYWDGPSGRIGQGVAMLRAKLTDQPELTGSHGDVATGAS